MSKFLTLVLVSLHESDIVACVGQLLTPYIENEEEDNSSAKMDYWLIGGIYDGVLTGGLSRLETVNKTHSSGGRLTGRRIPATLTDAEWLANNQIAVADLPPMADWDDEARAYAVVTPDGKWHDLYEPRAVSGKHKPAYLQQLLDQYRDCWTVIVMCHS